MNLRSIFGALGLLALGTGPLAAQEAQFDLIGDVVQKSSWTSDQWGADPASAWTFQAALKPKFTYGAASFTADTTWNLPLTASLTAAAPTVSVAEAYFRISPAEGLDLTFGQKRFSIGVGQTFTVGDSLNPVIGFFDQKTGFRGATAEWSPVSWASASGALGTEGGTGSTLKGAGQVSLLVDKLQLTTAAVWQKDVTFNPSVGASYDLFGLIVTAEGAAEFLPQGLVPAGAPASWKAPEAWNDPALSASAGARYTLTLGDWDFTASGEYLRWGQGWTKDEAAAWTSATGAAAAAAKPRALAATRGVRSTDNAFFRLSAVTGTAFSAGAFAAVDLVDRSVLGQGTVTWAPWDNLQFDLGLKEVWGSEGETWAVLPGTTNTYELSWATTYHF